MKMKKLFSVICLSAGLMLAMPMVAGATGTETGATTEQTTETPMTDQTEGTEAPVTEAPVTEAPVTEAPSTEPPATEAPASEAPAVAAYSSETPQTASDTKPQHTNTFVRDEQGNIHFYDENGDIYTKGLLEYEGKLYYLNPDEGYRLVGGPVFISGDLWLFGYDGALITGLSGLNHIDNVGDYYLNPDGHLDTGWKNVNNEWRYFSPENGQMVIGLIHDGHSMYYTDVNGKLCTGDFKGNDGVTWYYANKSGQLITGWRKSNGKWYYYSPLDGSMTSSSWITVNNKNYYVTGSGVMLTGWQKIDGIWYYMDGSGSRKTGWLKSNNKWYYLQPGTGAMVANEWINVDGKYYYLTNSGAMKTGWLQSGNDWYYLNSNGSMATGWKKVGSKWYYMNGDGTMKANCWMKDAGKWYYIRSSGAMATGWLKIDGNWYLFNNSGTMKTGWQISGGRWYYMDGSGKMMTGWQQLNGKWYYLNASGAMLTGWVKSKGYWYYLGNSGDMKTGWIMVNMKRYYLDPLSGRMYTGTQTVDGKTYNFGSSGGISVNPSEIPGSWSIKLNRANNCITVYKGSTAVKAMACSTGLYGPTPTGNFQILDKLRWHELDGPTWGQYCSHITSEILFHSVPMPAKSYYAVPANEYNLLGQAASHGCIRLTVGDAKWLYDNCPVGTSVTISDYEAMPLGKPTVAKIPASQNWDPTDPNIR